MQRCAFLTLEERLDFCIYDRLLFDPLKAIGWEVEEVPWSLPDLDWGNFDAVIIRSTWDYQHRPDAFLATLEEIERTTRLCNPVSVCRWNMNKRYLRDLEKSGVFIVPTRWPDRLEESTIVAALREFGTDRVVAKPLVGANADDTFVLSADDRSGWQAALTVFAGRPLMLQPFLTAVKTEGEYSLFFFAGIYSHAILKRPAPGDFRVQEEHGGEITPVAPPPDIAALAAAALAAVAEPLLYARIDVVRDAAGRPRLMELELIEPSLYFDQCDEAAANFVRAFQTMVDR